MTILLVDDNPTDAQLVRATLVRQDSELTIIDAETCQDALRMADTAVMDCIVMDEQLKGVRGSECVKQLRAVKFSGAFGLLTGFPDTRQAVDAMLNGADFYLSKDDIQTGLLSSIRSAVARRQDAIRAQAAADKKEREYREELERLRDQRQDDISPGWLDTQRDIKELTKSIAGLSGEVAAIKGTNKQQFEMLVKLNADWQEMLLKIQGGQLALRTTRWQTVGKWVLAAIATIETIALAYLAYLKLLVE